MMSETVEQRRGHLGVAEDGWPFAEGEVGGDDDRGSLVEPAHEVEEQLPAGLGEGQVAELVEDDEDAVQPLDAAIGSDLRETMTRVLGSLTPREERVMRMRFGIGTKSDHTRDEVSLQLSVSRERIRQIEAKALRKLQHPSRARVLRTFLDR